MRFQKHSFKFKGVLINVTKIRDKIKLLIRRRYFFFSIYY